jgi:hypothetical protein
VIICTFNFLAFIILELEDSQSSVIKKVVFLLGVTEHALNIFSKQTDNIVYNSVPLAIGQAFLATILNSSWNNVNRCLTYVRDSSNVSSNTSITQVINVFGTCYDCNIINIK